MRRTSVLAILAALTLVLTTETLHADISSRLTSLLVDLDGWEANTAEGTDVNMVGMKMASAIRTYAKKTAILDMSVMLGSNVLLQGEKQHTQSETQNTKTEILEINGFTVIITYSKTEKMGYIVIPLIEKESEGSMFVVNYSALSGNNALKIAKKFDWNKLKSVTGSLIQ